MIKLVHMFIVLRSKYVPTTYDRSKVWYRLFLCPLLYVHYARPFLTCYNHSCNVAPGANLPVCNLVHCATKLEQHIKISTNVHNVYLCVSCKTVRIRPIIIITFLENH